MKNILLPFIIAATTLGALAQETTELPLPAEKVEIVDVDGRVIVATVLSKDANGIRIQLGDKEHDIAWTKLSNDTVNKIKGVAVKPAPPIKTYSNTRLDYNQRVALENEIKDFKESLYKLPANEVHAMFVNQATNNDPNIAKIIRIYDAWWYGSWKAVWSAKPVKDPDWDKYNLNYFDIIKEIEIKDPKTDEKVSLRPKFEELGVKAREQEKDLCTLYSAQHFAQYAFLSAGMTPPSIAQLKEKIRPIHDWTETKGSIPSPKAVHVMGTFGKRPKVLWLHTPLGIKPEELVKHQLRNGRACSISCHESIGGSGGNHRVVVIGFETKGGKTTWEILNSNNTNIDGGYQTREFPMMWNEHANFSFWFE